MNYNKNPHSAYKTGAATLSKTKQVVMLYDGIIKFIKQAEEANKMQDFSARFTLLQKSCSIILGLQSSLDFEKGGKIAEILNRYYSSLDLRISLLNQTDSKEDFAKVVADVKKMRDSWKAVDENTGETSLPSSPLSQTLPGEMPSEMALALSI